MARKYMFLMYTKTFLFCVYHLFIPYIHAITQHRHLYFFSQPKGKAGAFCANLRLHPDAIFAQQCTLFALPQQCNKHFVDVLRGVGFRDTHQVRRNFSKFTNRGGINCLFNAMFIFHLFRWTVPKNILTESYDSQRLATLFAFNMISSMRLSKTETTGRYASAWIYLHIIVRW